MNRIRISLILTLIALFMGGCTRETATATNNMLPIVDDPLVLEYRFNIEDEVTNSNPTAVYPIDIYGDGRQGAVVVGNMWRPPVVQSLIIFYADIHRQQALHQININTAGLSPPYICDINHDGVQEVLTTYNMNDSLWLEIFRLDSGSIYRRFVATGIDRDGSGNWDGHGGVVIVADLDGDGDEEIIINCDVDYDLHPRALHCIDWKSDRILWEYPLANIALQQTFRILYYTDNPDTLLVFGTASKGNRVVTGDMDDQHAYLIALDTKGRERWKHVLGGSFTGAVPLIIDYDDDDNPDVACFQHGGESLLYSGEIDTLQTILRVYDRNGSVLDSVCFDGRVKANDAELYDMDSDGVPEMTFELSDNSLRVYDQHLQKERIIRCTSRFGIWDCRDFLGTGENQYLFDLHNTGLLLTDKDLNPLAQYNARRGFDRAAYTVLKRNKEPEIVIFITLSNQLANYLLTLESTPWYTMFSRRPILAFLAAFIPLTVIIGIIYLILATFRKKNKIISQQRDRLNDALTKLHETQEQLVAAEKYRLSKDIAGGVAHEIHNALFPARSSLAKLRERLGLTEPNDLNRNRTLLELSDKAVARALKMVELVRVYTRLDLEKKTESVNIKEMIEEILETNSLQISEQKTDVSLDIDPTIAIACFRPHAFSMLNNLVVNALQAMTDSPRKQLTVIAHDNGGRVEILISDTGPGIAEDHLNRIFDAFFSTRLSYGTGLGLTIVKRIVQLYDGEISVKSSLEKGTVFHILLPVT
ncbi:MAG: hypothetical protein JW763_08840 [candidate division Zixibacteria bacterium]|nr:hypothetical protein [candidate division Zixibacteria bacterium]